MRGKMPALSVIAALGLAIAGCNSSSDDAHITIPSSAMVTAFNLSADNKILPNLDSVFFSIDLLNGQIFNADSLPCGTPVTKLVPVVTTSGALSVEFIVERPGMNDTVLNYLEHPSDSIDFSRPVRMRIVSLDGQTAMSYTVRVNVHSVVADTLKWTRLESGSLPTPYYALSGQHTTQTTAKFYCMTSHAGEYTIANSADPTGNWQYVTPDFGFTPDINSLTGVGENALSILSADGDLYTSTDDGRSWSATGANWSYIYGAYGDRLLGSKKSAGKWYHVQWPADRDPQAMDAQFPVSGTSQAINYMFEMSAARQMLLVGGRLADGRLTTATWGYDGNSWARISQRGLPYALENMVLVPYFTSKTNTGNWRVTRNSVLLAMCGNRADGALNDTVYVSPDFGMHWQRADSVMQPSANAMPARTLAQGFVVNQHMTVAKSPRMHALGVEIPLQTYATEAITGWECPFIYIFGGQNAEGTTYNTMYRGVITRFTFKPLQ